MIQTMLPRSSIINRCLVSSLCFTAGLLVAVPAQAQTPVKPVTPTATTKCKLSRGCAYGPEVSDRWIKADRLVDKADFDGAIAEYQKALKAAKTLQLPKRTAAQMKVLRACAVNSSQAQLEGLKQAKDFQATHMITAENHKMAVQILRDRVQEVMAEQDAKYPELVGKCP